MSLAWHIARKDLLRLRVILLLWATLLTGRMALALIQSNLDPAGFVPFVVGAWVFGEIFLPLLGLGLVMGVLHDDSACDSDAFWITRPISGGLLLRAKLIVLALLGIFPSVLLAPWWLAHGYDVGQLTRAVIHTTREQFSLTLLVLPLAVLSASTGRFVMNLLLAAVVFLLLSLVYAQFWGNLGLNDSPLAGSAWSRVLIAAWIIGGAAVFVHQYLSRRTRRSFSLALITVAVGFTASVFLRSSGTSAADHPPGSGPNAPRSAAVLRPEVGRASLDHGFRLRVNEAYPLYPQSWNMSVNESSPDFTYPIWIAAPPTPAPAGHESYFLVSRRDGRAVRARMGAPSQTLITGELLAGTFHYSRRSLSFPMPEWTRDASDNFKAWVADADLVKVISTDDLKEFPRELRPSIPSP